MSRKLINVVMQGGGGSAAELAVNTTWAELKSMRDNSQLTVGCLYRITDYETIISGEDVQSAGHVFDIVVLATDVNVLSEDAMAVHSERDTDGYFASSKLEAWELKYCLDNDTTRFAWASEGGEQWTINLSGEFVSAQLISDNDTTYDGYPYYFIVSMMGVEFQIYLAHLELQDSEEFIPNVVIDNGESVINQISILGTSVSLNIEGKGVIYHLKDEFLNECPYDFKNIQFARYRIISTVGDPNELPYNLYDTYSGIKNIDLILPEGYEIDDNDRRFFYTFSYINDGNIYDAVLGNIVLVNNNIINNIGYLNNIVFIANYNVALDYNVFYSCKNLNFLDSIHNNIFTEASSCLFKNLSESIIEGADDNPMNLIIETGSFIHLKNSFNCRLSSAVRDVNLINCINVNIGYLSRNIKLNTANNVDISDRVENLISFGDLNNVIIPSNIVNIQILAGVGGTSSSDRLTLDFITNKMITQVAGKDSQGNLKIWNPADLVQA